MTLEPPTLTTTRRLKSVAPLQAGKLAALVYGALGLLFLPFFLVISLVGSQMPGPQKVGFMAMGVGFAVLMPVLYAVMGFVLGCLGAFIYNLAAKWVGGLEFEVE
jgi:hypothetical protein